MHLFVLFREMFGISDVVTWGRNLRESAPLRERAGGWDYPLQPGPWEAGRGLGRDLSNGFWPPRR